ncbi:zinc finger SWIM domain-containing protein 1-like [Electrophorus electricus]|uniref:zinc finger SWIM domain-containing protein 1-like n=1 Tax=Electrophorus electricus TaxID=8005 RepID=UPI0015CFCEA7|nr:zinc finger SWIM domain-containing protein 1-like [Electrophorus electricus]
MDEQGLDSKVQPDQEPSEQCAHSPRPDRTVTQRPRPDRSVTQRPRPDRSVTQRPRPDRTVTQRPRPDRTVTQRPRPDRTVTQRPGLDSTQAQSSELDHTLAKLKHDAGCTVEVLVDQDNILKGIFYQDTTMQKHFDLFPEVLVVTTACRLFDMYVYVQLAVDGNGHSDLVSMFVVSDSSKSISAMVDIFKRYNRAWERIQVVVMAEYRMERLVYASHYPKAQIFITPSRVTRTMKQEISQMDTLTVQQKQESLHLLQQIAHSNGEQSYQKNVEHLHKIGIQLVIDYYNRTWHPIREHWVVGLKECCLYSQNTTRQLAQFQRRLNQCIHALGDLRGFCQDIKTLVDSLRGVLREAAIAQLHVKAEAGELVLLSSVWHRYLNLLTPYASQLVARQLGLSEQVDFEQELTAGDTVVLDSASGIITITATSCTCPFATLNRLPCRHMFAFREKCGLNLFSEEGLAPRWCLKHSCRNDQQGELGGGGGDLGREEQGDSCGEEQGGGADQGSSEHTAARHHRRAARMARALMLLICATSSSALHEERIAVLQQVLHLWEEDKHATVVELIQVTV